MSEHERVRETLDAINAAWREGRLDELDDLLRPDVIYVAPGFSARLEGRDACIASYRDFLAAAEVHDYAADPPTVELFGNTAIATYRFEIDYSVAGQRSRESGHDLFVFTRDDGRWRAAWRTLIAVSPVL